MKANMSAAKKARRSKMTKTHFQKRQSRTRFRIASNAAGRPRLSVFRSGRHIYAQVIDDRQGSTLASASSNEKEGKSAKTYNVDAAKSVGKKIAERALAKGVKALADAAREGGLEF